MAKELKYKRDPQTGAVYLDEGQTFNPEVAARLVDFEPNERLSMWKQRMDADRARLNVKAESPKQEKKEEPKKEKKSIDDIDL